MPEEHRQEAAPYNPTTQHKSRLHSERGGKLMCSVVSCGGFAG